MPDISQERLDYLLSIENHVSKTEEGDPIFCGDEVWVIEKKLIGSKSLNIGDRLQLIHYWRPSPVCAKVLCACKDKMVLDYCGFSIIVKKYYSTEEGAASAAKKMMLDESCKTCDGTGEAPWISHNAACPDCNGTGNASGEE